MAASDSPLPTQPPTQPRNPLERVELRDQVAAEIRESILGGEFARGERLVETELAARYGTSRGPVRDALADLEQSGLVYTIKRRGSFVASFTNDDLTEVYAVRTALEGLAIREAINRSSAGDIARLQELLAALDAAHQTGDTRTIGEADMRFHRSIVQSAHNGRLLDAWDRLADQTVLLMCELTHVRPDIQGPGGDHGKIVEAFEARDATRGQQAIVDHLASAAHALQTHFEAAEQS